MVLRYISEEQGTSQKVDSHSIHRVPSLFWHTISYKIMEGHLFSGIKHGEGCQAEWNHY